MKRATAGILLLLFISPLFGLSKTPPKEPKERIGVLIIDDFEDGQYAKKWWAFDNVTLSIVPGKGSRYALQIKGFTRDWYVGGIGSYLAKPNQDVSKYNSLDLNISGSGPNSGTLRIELYDDDNGNWQIEQDPKKGYAPIYDDRFVYELKIDWSGFKHLAIPFYEFVDNNPEAGDNVWNPQQIGGSGGLIQMQIVIIAPSKADKINLAIDNLELRESGLRK